MESRSTTPFFTHEEILDSYACLCSSLPGKVDVHLFCREEHKNETTCFIRVPEGIADETAELVHGIVYGGTVVVMIPLADTFTCPMRSNGQMRITSCDLCRRQVGKD